MRRRSHTEQPVSRLAVWARRIVLFSLAATLIAVILVRSGDSQKAAFDSTKRDLLAKREDLERQLDLLKYQKAAMLQNDYEQQLNGLLVGLARIQSELDK